MSLKRSLQSRWETTEAMDRLFKECVPADETRYARPESNRK